MSEKIIIPPETELQKTLRYLHDNLANIFHYNNYMATLHKHKFDCLKNQGFSDEQALELCKVVDINFRVNLTWGKDK